MIKSFATTALIFLGSLCSWSQDPVSVKMTVPSVVGAGQEFRVSLLIEKGDLEEFSRFQQELPAGLEARQENSGSADYSFDKQRIRFIWLKLPAENPIVLTYKIMVNERLKGTFTLGGEFSYVENNERKSITVKTENVNISPSPLVAEDMQIDIRSYEDIMAAEQVGNGTGRKIVCVRQTPFQARTGNDIMVNLLVYKQDLNRFAKIEERIPPGFEAVVLESMNGLFTFKDGVAKYVWMTLPDQKGFTISYRLIPEGSKSLKDLQIKGTFSYISNGRNISVDVIEKDVYLSGISQANIEALIEALSSGGELPAGEEYVTEQTETKEITTEVEKPPVKEEKPPDESVERVEQSTPDPRLSSGSSSIPNDQRLPVQDGVYYRVQLAATKVYWDAVTSFASYNISRPVRVEWHNAMYKYTAGSFSKYGEANDFRQTMVTKGIPGAFVVAYRNGSRINVADARRVTGD